jgi:hypothetical protein
VWGIEGDEAVVVDGGVTEGVMKLWCSGQDEKFRPLFWSSAAAWRGVISTALCSALKSAPRHFKNAA